MAVLFYQNDSSPYDIEILVALPDREGSGSWEEFMAEDFCDEDVLGHVFGFESVAADSGVALRRWPGFQDWSREPKALETYLA